MKPLMKSTALTMLMAMGFGSILITACSDSADTSAQTAKQASAMTQTNSYQQLDQYFNALAAEDRALGSAAIYRNGEAEYEVAFVLDKDKVSQSDDLYRYKIGSISKTFTAVLVFQMIEAGKLSLESKLSEFFPNIENADNISIQMLLNHHSGIANYTDSPDFTSYFQQPQTNEAMVNRIEQLEPAFEPGAKGEYSNSNYLLLGYILEALSSKDYGELLQEKIAKPLGLAATYLEEVTEADKNEVRSFMKNQGWQAVPQWHMSSADAAGALVSTTEDLNRFFSALFAGELISKQSLATMLAEQDGFAHGIFKREVALGDKKVEGYWHNGRIENYLSNMIYFPEQKLGIAYLSNGGAYDVGKINQTLIKAAFGNTITIPEFKTVELSVEQLEPLVGDYASETHPLDIKVMLNDGQLFAQATGQGAFPLTAIEPDTFEFAAAGIEIKFDAENKQFVIKQGGRADIFIEKSSQQAAKKITVAEAILESYVGLYKADDFPLDIEVMLKEGDLFAQATGQSAFPLTPVNDTEFKFALAGIVIKFDASKKQLAITQGGSTNIMTKE